MHTSHWLITCAAIAIVCFGAGAVYAHTLAAWVVNDFKKEIGAATAEIKKFRGEIFKDRASREG